MTNLTNLQRDMTWLGDVTSIAEPGATAFGASTINIGTDNVAYQMHGHFQYWSDTNLSAGSQFAFGVSLAQIEEDNVPFRMKCKSNSDQTLWGVAFTNTLAATVAATGPRLIGFGREIDDIVCLRPPAAPTSYATFFGLLPGASVNPMIMGSIQRMFGKPDTYSSQVY